MKKKTPEYNLEWLKVRKKTTTQTDIKDKCFIGSLISKSRGKVGFRFGLIQWFSHRITDLFLFLFLAVPSKMSDSV